jgi:hypothetical protein
LTLKSVQRGKSALPLAVVILREVMCLHSYTFVFSLQETEGKLSFDYLLQHHTTNYAMDKGDFEEFSFANHAVKT